MIDLPRLMLVTDRRLVRGGDLRRAVSRAVQGGVGLVQVRERDLADPELTALVESLRAEIGEAARIVINGRPDLARDLRVGLHLSAAAPAPEARAGRGGPWPVGRSAHDEEEARRAVEQGVDYILLGTIYRTRSKPGRQPAGPDLVRAVTLGSPDARVLAIGGVVVHRIPELLRAGAYGVAACRAFLRAPDPLRVAQAMTLALTLGALDHGKARASASRGSRSRRPRPIARR